MNLLKNKVVWITGGAKGIGASLSRVFLENEAKVVASGSNELDYYIDNEYLNEWVINNPNFAFKKCDVRRINDINNIYEYIINEHFKFDILVNNAGIGLFKPFENTTIEEFDNIMDVNIKGPFNCMQKVIPDMLKKQDGTIVNISSVAALDNFANCSIYNLSKSGLLTLSRSLRNEYRTKGIKFIDIIPGATDSNIWDNASRIQYSERLMKPYNLAKMIVDAVRNSYEGNLLVEELIIRPIYGNI